MQPIGLTFKNIKYNPYTDKTSGELMVIHLCLNCGQISCNRIAGDDNAYTIISLLEISKTVNQNLIDKLNMVNIKLLTDNNKHKVLITLYGYDYQKWLK